MMIPRQVLQLKTEQQDQDKTEQSPVTPVGLSSLRDQHAWVLLGEPGAGKTTAFEEEAKACGGEYISVAEFIHPDNSLDDRQDTTLFLDGLDENTGDIQNTLISIRNRLNKLNQPKFRLACRAADWQGAFFLEKLQGATPAQTEIAAYTLQPLSAEDIQTRVETYFQQHGTPEQAKKFLELRKQHQASNWLGNPQTLEWMLELPANEWPQTKQELFEKTCERLAQEHNRTHRGKQRQNPTPDTNDILVTAGELCALLLLSNKQGIAMDRDSKTALYPELNDFQPSNTSTCTHALKTQLFKPAHSAQEHLEPIHRSVAEYLAAKYLAKQLDNQQLPLSRLLNVLTGHDRKCIDGLRNLYAWLVNCSTSAREILLKQDPLSVALYGNTENWTKQQTEAFLGALKQAISKDPYLLYRDQNDQNLKNLYHPALLTDYLESLRSPERTEAHQGWLRAVLCMLTNAPCNAELSKELLRLIKDHSHFRRVRQDALDLWLQTDPSEQERTALLNDIQSQKTRANNRELLGILLHRSYPSHLSREAALAYLGPLDASQGEDNHYDTFVYFWTRVFPENIPTSDLKIALDTLAQHPVVKSIGYHQHHLADMLSALLARAFTEWGDQTTDAQLLDWLMMGIDRHGTNHLKDNPLQDQYTLIVKWMNARPERYKGVLHECFQRAEQEEDEPFRKLRRFERALEQFKQPSDLGAWHLQQVDTTHNLTLKNQHLMRAVDSLSQNSTEALTLEQLEQWAANDARKQAMLKQFLEQNIEDWRWDEWAEEKTKKQEQIAEKQKRSEELETLLPAIADGTAPIGHMHFSAILWNGETNYHGNTPEERLANYCYQADKLKHAIEQGMPRCLDRNDLPTPEEIIRLHIRNEYHYIRSACLLGAQFTWEKDPEQLLHLPESTLQTLVCFQFTSHELLNETAWFLDLSKQHPTLVANIFIALGKACIKAKLPEIPKLKALAYAEAKSPELHAIAQRSTIPLLEAFPLRTTEAQHSQLRTLLHMAQHTNGLDFKDLITKKLTKKSLDAAQKIYWLLAGLLKQHSATAENELLAHLRRSNQQLQHFHKFCITPHDTLKIQTAEKTRTSHRHGKSQHNATQAQTTDLSVLFLGQLIELSAPHVPTEWPTYSRGTALDWHNFTHTLIQELAKRTTPESIAELERLSSQPACTAVHYALRSASHEATQRLREQTFTFLPLSELSRILNNKPPVNAADLHALTLACLDDIAQNIRTSNSDTFRQFWNEDNNKPTTHKNENSCRDVLLGLLTPKLNPLDVICERERDSHNHKRADIQLSVGPNISIAIEIKGEWHKDLWDAIQNQLIPQYTREKSSEDFGIYVVLWVGDTAKQPVPRDGGKKPQTPEELEERLRQHCIPIEKKSLIEVRVLDVSWSA